MSIFQPAALLKVTLLHGYFPRFLNCTNGTKLLKASHMRITKAIWAMSLKWVNLVLLAASHIIDIVHTAISLNYLLNFRTTRVVKIFVVTVIDRL